jgi:hypothetical protein
MALNSITRKSNQGRDIKYLNKDFAGFRQNLIEYAKTYFPQTYSDFNETSPGMMFIEMASYIGDVLGYYIDDTLKESLMLYAEDKENVIALAQYLGYKPKVTSPALTRLSVYQLVPATGLGVNNRPVSDYFLRVKEGMVVEANTTGTLFRTTELLDFGVEDEREITIYRKDTNNEPTFYLVKKYVNAISAELKTVNVTFGTAQEFSKIDLAATNVIQIYDVRDSNGNKWYEVPYLAQEMVFVDYPISNQTDKDLVQFKDSVANVLKLVKTSRRFVTKVNADNTTTIVFGGGNSTSSDETLIPNFKNVGLGLNSSIDNLGASFDPANFLKTRSYGQAPSGTIMTVSYLVGGGISANTAKGELTRIQNISFDEDTNVFSDSELILYRTAKGTVAIENETAANGARGAETIDEIRENALANFSSQNRAVTRKDYQVRALSLPAKYGGIAKAYCAPDGELDNNSPSSILSNPDTLSEFTGIVTSLQGKNEMEIKDAVNKFLIGKKNNLNEKNNPFAINLYVLGYDSNKNLVEIGTNQALKENLKTYLNEFRMLTDGVNLLNGFVINIGVDFEIRVYGGYNKREVLIKCIDEITNYFNIDNWTFNMAINLSELELLIAGVEGVQSVPKCEIINKCLGQYSSNSYNIAEATKGKMVYPSLDPSVFELKYPAKDIKGRVV